MFLFAVGKQAARASIPLNRWLGLDETPAALYRVKEIYPREGADLGVYRYGDELLYDMPDGTAVILSLEPAASGSQPRQPVTIDRKAQIQEIPAFSGGSGNTGTAQ